MNRRRESVHLPTGIALGSNVGDRLALLREARDRLQELHEGSQEDFRISPVYETAPVGCAPGTAPFLNAVIELGISADRSPHDLLDFTQTIERSLGRPSQRSKNAPRTIDVDLLYCGDRAVDDERLVLPHPRLRERRFVLVPLRDLAGGTVYGSDLVTAWLDAIDQEEPEPVLFAARW